MRATRASEAARDFVRRCEADGGPVLKAYKKSAADPVTIGFGYTGKVVDDETGDPRAMVPWIYDDEGGIVQRGDEITVEQAHFYFDQDCNEAERRVDFFFEHVELSQHQRDALFSFCFNLRWSSILNSTLRQIILHGEWINDQIVEWWPKYRNPRTIFEEGLYRRRLAEMLVFLFGVSWDLAYREAWKAVLERDGSGGFLRITNPELVIMRALKAQEEAGETVVAEAAQDETGTDSAPAVLQVVADDAPEVVEPVGQAAPQAPRNAITLPDDWDSMTESEQVAWLNGGQRARLVVRRSADVIELPNVDRDAEPKDMRDSDTHRGFSKADSGRESMVVGGAVGAITAGIPLARELAGFFSEYDVSTILMAGGGFALVFVAVGLWRWWRGRIIAYEGRISATRPKV